MNKIYKYRPLNSFLFKELLYQELYFATLKELNDPLDMNAKITFTFKSENEINSIYNYIIFSEIKSENHFSNVRLLTEYFYKGTFNKILFEKIKNQTLTSEEIANFLEEILNTEINGFIFNKDSFILEIKKLKEYFLEKSSICCFSKVKNNFLMWSHYASNHQGICLEFKTYKDNKIISIESNKYRQNIELNSPSIINLSYEGSIFYDFLYDVKYSNDDLNIDFIEYYPIFDNIHDCDVQGISKSWVHNYANKIKSVHSIKKKVWRYEKEVRMINVNFSDEKYPEERIWNYPQESLTGIYFGLKTPIEIKKRILKMMHFKNKSLKFFNSFLNKNDKIYFEEICYDFYSDEF